MRTATYRYGVLVKSLPPSSSEEYEANAIPEPRCPRCRTKLAFYAKGKFGPFWGCGDYPRCRFTASDQVIQEAIKRQLNSGR